MQSTLLIVFLLVLLGITVIVIVLKSISKNTKKNDIYVSAIELNISKVFKLKIEAQEKTNKRKKSEPPARDLTPQKFDN